MGGRDDDGSGGEHADEREAVISVVVHGINSASTSVVVHGQLTYMDISDRLTWRVNVRVDREIRQMQHA